MAETNYPGIDYSCGTANFNSETGIHYGVINMNALSEWAWEDFEADYGDPFCPDCATEIKGSDEYTDVETDAHRDYYCDGCRKSWWSDQCIRDEPLGWSLDSSEYKAFVDSSGDVMILKSPYYTHAQYCSPCAPGAGYLESPCKDGPKTYCLGLNWFSDDCPCPYPIYRVVDGSLAYSHTLEEEEDHDVCD